MNEILMRLVAENLAFLELTDDELIDPDIAVSSWNPSRIHCRSSREASKRRS